MRAVVAVAGLAAGVLLAGLATPEGLGDVATRERAMRDGAATPSVSACPTDAGSPRLIWMPPLEYPARAAADRIPGFVKLEVIVAPDGSVRESRVQNRGGDPGLVEAVRSHVGQRRYCPAFKAGVAVETRLTVAIIFKQAHQEP